MRNKGPSLMRIHRLRLSECRIYMANSVSMKYVSSLLLQVATLVYKRSWLHSLAEQTKNIAGARCIAAGRFQHIVPQRESGVIRRIIFVIFFRHRMECISH
jgi:hypothetical protein